MVFRILPRILYVDCDDSCCEMVRSSLSARGKGFDLHCTANMADAIAKIRSETFDLYIFEYCLPVVTGAQLCKIIRATGIKAPIIMYSALFRDVDRDMAFDAGANSYLIKPDEFDKLSTTIERLLCPPPIISRHYRPGRHAASII